MIMQKYEKFTATGASGTQPEEFRTGRNPRFCVDAPPSGGKKPQHHIFSARAFLLLRGFHAH